MYGGTVGCQACDLRDPKRTHTMECRARFAEHIARETRDNVETVEPEPAAPPADPLLRPVPPMPIDEDNLSGASGSGGPGMDISYLDEEQEVPPAPAVGPLADDHMLGVLIGTEDHFDSEDTPEAESEEGVGE